MKKIAIVTLFPEMFCALTDYGVTGRAVNQGLLAISYVNPRDFTEDKHHTVDDRPYGGGPGMVMKIEPLKAAIRQAKACVGTDAKVIYLSPQGRLIRQAAVRRFASAETYTQLVLIAGRYEGIDERLIEAEVDEEWSIGDYVLSGGELPAMVLLDAIIRLLPGALGHPESANEDSFSQNLLDYPHYTRPEVYRDQVVPAVLLSGNHKSIKAWRERQALQRTWLRRPELLDNVELSPAQQKLLEDVKTNDNSS